MITLNHVRVSFFYQKKREDVLTDITATFNPRAGMIGILGARKSGKSTLLSVLGGIIHPDAGTLTCSGSTSWLMSSMRPLVHNMTVRANIRFIGMLYGVDVPILFHSVITLSGLQDVTEMLLNELPRDIQAHLVYCICLCLKFDYYLADESFLIGDDKFRKNMTDYLTETSIERTIILASRSPSLIKKHCQVAYVLHGGRLHYFGQASEAVRAFKTLNKN
ncbi:P-loop NTPase family protein [Novacetimonas hansenii]|uniref:ABC transporter domain-containing protein n=1 Tax=Novacetimonas hansenii TaxID=436 RepID=A0AAW5EM06_NOVHA|nr:hypothetical protein [Novacetimonas hansenii]MCJ8352832.1 hypothetical protein [Novacetimonas hansenii]